MKRITLFVCFVIVSAFSASQANAQTFCLSGDCSCNAKKQLWDVAKKDLTNQRSAVRYATSFLKTSSKKKISYPSALKTEENNRVRAEKKFVTAQNKYTKALAAHKKNERLENETCHGFLGSIDRFTDSKIYRKCQRLDAAAGRTNVLKNGAALALELTKNYVNMEIDFIENRIDVLNDMYAIYQKGEVGSYQTILAIAQKQVANASASYDSANARVNAARNAYFSCRENS